MDFYLFTGKASVFIDYFSLSKYNHSLNYLLNPIGLRGLSIHLFLD